MPRGSLVVIQECQIRGTISLAEWSDGPLPLSVTNGDGIETRSGETERLDYFSHRVAAALYPAGRRRWRHFANGFLEVLAPAENLPDSTYLVIWHQSLGDSYEASIAGDDVLNAIEAMQTLVAPAMTVERECLRVVRSFYMVSGVIDEFARGVLPSQYDDTWTIPEQYAWRLATLINSEFGDTPPLDEMSNLKRNRARVNLTKDLLVIVEHDGCSLVGVTDEHESPDPFESWLAGDSAHDDSQLTFVELEWHTIFLDCFLLGILQRSGLNRIADQFAGLTDHQPRVSEMLKLERSFAEFKAAVWWHQVTEERAANQVLRAFQREHSLDDLLAELGRDLSHYSDQIQTLSVARSSAALTVLSLTLLPITVILYIIQSVVPANWGDLLRIGAFLLSVPIALALAMGLAALIPGYLELLRDVIRRSDK
jgi:hypothetical protein